MQFTAKTRFLGLSPYKLRPIVDVVRGKDAQHALYWLTTHKVKRTEPIYKMISSAVANAQHAQAGIEAHNLMIKDIRVDEGPKLRYFKPGAMGRANLQTRRFSHMSVILEARNAEKQKVKKSAKRKEA